MFDYHPEKGRVTDDSTGRDFGCGRQNRPVEHLDQVPSLVLSQRTQIKFWVLFGHPVTECLTVESTKTTSGDFLGVVL